jgi:hypothetical protein
MKEYRIEGADVPLKLNTEILAHEIAAKLGLAPEAVGLTTYDNFKVLVVHLPDETSTGRVMEAVNAHAPNHDDHEADAYRKQQQSDAQIRGALVRLGVLLS